MEKNALASCLRLAQAGSAILLFEDGVYAALQNTVQAELMTAQVATFAFYVLGPDLAARGLSTAQLIGGITVIDYEGFVDLVVEHDSSQSWL